MKIALAVVLTFSLSCCCLAGDLVNLNVKYMLGGYCLAGSAPHKNDMGGFAKSDNMPREFPDFYNPDSRDVELIAFPDQKAIFQDKYRGFVLLLANDSRKAKEFTASDSRIPIIMQARIGNTWKNIEYLPAPFCGNSYHTITLPRKKCWVFSVPEYAGTEKVLLRFKLNDLTSNTFQGLINIEQLSVREGDQPQNVTNSFSE
jgi:hypothetical protein